MRDFVSKDLPKLAQETRWAGCDITTRVVKNRHPLIEGHYAKGPVKTVCVRKCTPDEIANWIERFRTSNNHKVTTVSHRTKTKTPSIQGEWRAGMWT